MYLGLCSDNACVNFTNTERARAYADRLAGISAQHYGERAVKSRVLGNVLRVECRNPTRAHAGR